MWRKAGGSYCIQYDKESGFIGEWTIFHQMIDRCGQGYEWNTLKIEIGEKTF